MVPRCASVLLLTLVVVALLALGTMSFFERMFAEHRAARAFGRQLQARHLAESGVEYLKFVLMQEPIQIQQSGGLFANPDAFQGQMVIEDPLPAFRGRFTIIAPDLTTGGYYSGIRYGLENESARLNLNTVLLADSVEDDGARTVLLTLPGMTESIADAILDWIDTDEEPRLLGAERDYYSSLDPPYAPRNGPLHSIEELLLVRDVTPALLFGADLDRNSLVAAAEEPFTIIDNVDNSAGTLNRGWAAYLTLDSAEKNVRADGQPKIDINMQDLEELHTQLTAVLDQEMATFIVAFRQGGAYEGEEVAQPASGLNIDFEQQGSQRFASVLDLIGANTRVVQVGQTERTVVQTPFPDEPSAMQSYLPQLMDNLAVNASPTIPGRLNINQAPRALLSGVPGLDPAAVEQIIANRDVTLGDEQPDQAYETWLLMQRVVELEDMKKLMPLITAGGSVYRAQIVGYFEAEGPAARIEVVIDATETPAIVRRRRELTELGPGYSLETLGAAADAP